MADLPGRKVTIHGKEFLVTEDMAKSLEEHEKKLRDELKPKEIIAPAPKAPDAPTVTGWGERIFTEPDKVLDEMRGRIEQEFETKLSEREAKNRQQTILTDFWRDFLTHAPDLKDDVDLARQILSSQPKVFQEIDEQFKSDPVQNRQKVLEKLADLTRAKILSYIKRSKEGSEEEVRSEHPFVEGATLKAPSPPPVKPEEKPSSLTAIIKARQAARKKTAA